MKMNKITIKNSEMIDIVNALEGLGNIKAGVRFAMWVAQNLKNLKPKQEVLSDLLKTPKVVEDWQKEISRVRAKYTFEQKPGEPARFLPGKEEEFITVREEMREKYSDLDEAIDEHNKKVEEVLKEEIEVHLYTIDIEDLPETVTGNMILPLFQLISDKKKETGKDEPKKTKKAQKKDNDG